MVTVKATFKTSGGAIDSTGLFTAGSSYGTYRVIATAENLADTSDVTIAPRQVGTEIYPGQSIQAAVNAFPAGTAFLLKAGMHRMQQVMPKDGNTFTGEAGAIMSGARILGGWEADGNGRWYVSGQTQQNTDYNPNYTCQSGHGGCFYPEQLWVDGGLYEHVTSLGAVRPGTWYFDYAADRIYLPLDPAGQTVETSVTRFAFGGAASGVTVKNLIVEKYATEAQQATVNHGKARSWTIEANEIRHNHGVGATVSANGVIRGNEIHHQGQAGVMAFGLNPLVEGNYIHHNNTAYFGPGPYGMAGGSKFVETNGLIVRNNVSTHNDGPGLWTDINNVNCLYEGNRVDSNGWRGIFHEISYDCVIRNNTVRHNGHDYPGSSVGAFEGAGILISNSPNVEVYGNVVEDNRNGIMAREDDRDANHPSPLGPHHTVNLWVHDNTVRQMDSGRAAGITDTDPYADPYTSVANNRWSRNTYIVGTGAKWRWKGNLDVSRTEWLTGQDSGSIFR